MIRQHRNVVMLIKQLWSSMPDGKKLLSTKGIIIPNIDIICMAQGRLFLGYQKYTKIVISIAMKFVGRAYKCMGVVAWIPSVAKWIESCTEMFANI